MKTTPIPSRNPLRGCGDVERLVRQSTLDSIKSRRNPLRGCGDVERTLHLMVTLLILVAILCAGVGMLKEL